MPEDQQSDSGARKPEVPPPEPQANDNQEEKKVHDDDDPAPEPTEEEESKKFFVVGIGASAGGLEALAELTRYVPLDCMAFVVVQHLAPQHESVLAHLLSRTSKMEVLTASDGMRVEPNHIYVIPPNTDLALMHGVLHLIAPAGGASPRMPIDYFFRSLADDQLSSAIGIVLSGTGSDGTFGLKAIKAAGGMTFVQQPSSAKYDGMPRSALASGYADFCLTPREIADELTRISEHPQPLRLQKARSFAPQVQEQLAKLFVLIRTEFGNDVSLYKPSTVDRRIERRMALHRLATIDDYLKYVQSNAEELHALYRDMLITVTSFFRDQKPFDVLKTTVLPQLLQHKGADASIRIWIPACATGEEAYSLAICVLEFLEEKTRDIKVQIFGTDVDEDSIQHARRGVYPQSIALDVSPDRLNRFFIKKDNDYQVCRSVRDMVVFSKQNLLKDAPFSRLDLVSCRNLLIYLKSPTQKNVLRILHYSLNPLGFLLLGTSETVGDAPDLFSLVDRKNKLYSKKHVASAVRLEVGFGAPRSPEIIPPSSFRPPLTLQSLADRKTLERYGPPGVVINESLEILHFQGRTGPYLDPIPGAASFDILRLARPELHIELKRAIQQAFLEQLPVSAEVQFRDEGNLSAVRIDVVPITEMEAKTRCLMVFFQKLAPPKEIPIVAAGPGEENQTLAPLSRRLQELERELVLTKEYLQTTIEEKETANEELKSANEELQSSNEELQSTNEELETSKEEMQSTNEELTTVNDELQNRMGELSQTNDDLHNVLLGVDNAVIIVGMDLRVRRYTSAAEKLLNLVPADVGRSITYIERFCRGMDIGKNVSAAIETLSTAEEEILCGNHRWYALRITPYKTLDHVIRGAVLSLTDIDVRKKASEMTRDVGEYAGKFLAAIGHPLLIVDAKLRVVWANESFFELFKVAREETIGGFLPDIGNRQWADPDLVELLSSALVTGKTFRDFRIRHRFEEIGQRTMRIGGSRMPLATESALILVSIEEDSPSGRPLQ